MKIDKNYIQALHRPDLLIYWVDIVMCAAIGWGAFTLCIYNQNLYFKALAFLVSAFAIYRGQTFIHEVVHQRNAVKGLALFYELFFGWPNAYPSYIYDPHLYHHIPKEYGTSADPEYLAGTNNTFFKMMIAPITSAIVLPFLLTLRFGIIPIFLLVLPRFFRDLIFKHASTLVVNISYIRPKQTENELFQMKFNDLMCVAYRVLFCVAIYVDTLAIDVAYTWFILVIFVSMINMYRAKVAHYYLGTGKCFSKQDQLLDSVTISGTIFSELWAPLFLRFHAGHHLYPQMPYHSLKKLHKYLTSDEMKKHPYNQTVFQSFSQAARFFMTIDIKSERKVK